MVLASPLRAIIEHLEFRQKCIFYIFSLYFIFLVMVEFISRTNHSKLLFSNDMVNTFNSAGKQTKIKWILNTYANKIEICWTKVASQLSKTRATRVLRKTTQNLVIEIVPKLKSIFQFKLNLTINFNTINEIYNFSTIYFKIFYQNLLEISFTSDSTDLRSNPHSQFPIPTFTLSSTN